MSEDKEKKVRKEKCMKTRETPKCKVSANKDKLEDYNKKNKNKRKTNVERN